jgi:hypothetical protein
MYRREQSEMSSLMKRQLISLFVVSCLGAIGGNAQETYNPTFSPMYFRSGDFRIRE